jgi:universal stress protein A
MLSMEAAMNINRVVVPCDFSKCSVAALRFAARFAAPVAKIYVVHIDELLDARVKTLPPLDLIVVPDSYWDQRRRKIKRRLAWLAPATSGAVYDYHWQIGLPTEQILVFAEGVNADLIVIGSHGRTGLSRLITGSVAEQVMRQAKCPVLVVKAPLVQPRIAVFAPTVPAALRVGNDFVI